MICCSAIRLSSHKCEIEHIISVHDYVSVKVRQVYMKLY